MTIDKLLVIIKKYIPTIKYGNNRINNTVDFSVRDPGYPAEVVEITPNKKYSECKAYIAGALSQNKELKIDYYDRNEIIVIKSIR